MGGPSELWMILPYHWATLSPEQINNDLNGVRLNVETPALTAYRHRYDALNSGAAYASQKNRAVDINNPGSTMAPFTLERKGDEVRVKTQGVWNTLTEGDKLCLYRIDPTRCSQPWTETYEGSQEFITHGVSEYEEFYHDTLRNLIKDAGLRLIN